MNWMILTKMLRGVSLGTTLREPLGKSADTILSSRLKKKRRRKRKEGRRGRKEEEEEEEGEGRGRKGKEGSKEVRK